MIEKKACPKCGTQNNINSLRCIDCDNSLNRPSLQSLLDVENTKIDDIEIEYFKAFVGKESESYIKKWTRLENSILKLSFNAFALLFSPLWIFIRKMYSVGLIYLLIIFAISTTISINSNLSMKSTIDTYVEAKAKYAELIKSPGTYPFITSSKYSAGDYINNQEVINKYMKAQSDYSNQRISWAALNLGLTLVFSFCFSLKANHIYFIKAKKNINRITMETLDQDAIVDRISKAGGTNVLIAIIICIASSGVISILRTIIFAIIK